MGSNDTDKQIASVGRLLQLTGALADHHLWLERMRGYGSARDAEHVQRWQGHAIPELKRIVEALIAAQSDEPKGERPPAPKNPRILNVDTEAALGVERWLREKGYDRWGTGLSLQWTVDMERHAVPGWGIDPCNAYPLGANLGVGPTSVTIIISRDVPGRLWDSMEDRKHAVREWLRTGTLPDGMTLITTQASNHATTIVSGATATGEIIDLLEAHYAGERRVVGTGRETLAAIKRAFRKDDLALHLGMSVNWSMCEVTESADGDEGEAYMVVVNQPLDYRKARKIYEDWKQLRGIPRHTVLFVAHPEARMHVATDAASARDARVILEDVFGENPVPKSLRAPKGAIIHCDEPLFNHLWGAINERRAYCDRLHISHVIKPRGWLVISMGAIPNGIDAHQAIREDAPIPGLVILVQDMIGPILRVDAAIKVRDFWSAMQRIGWDENAYQEEREG